jgi:hypothetical protein
VGWKGVTLVAEVKRPKGKLTTAQVNLRFGWRGHPIPVLTTAEEASTWLLATVPHVQRTTPITWDDI